MTTPALYLASIVLVNYGFSVIPLWHGWPPMSLVVGFVFVLRDFAQREIGHRILGLVLVGGVLSWFMASPFVAVASVTAFAFSELADWVLYSFSKRPFAQRVLLSSAVSTPVDSVIFLGMIDHLSVFGVATMVASKMLGALIVWLCLRKRECFV